MSSPWADAALRTVLRLAPVWLLLALTLPLAAAPLTNADTYFHLRFGREFLDSWSLRDPGHVSPLEERQWLPTQWGSEIAMASLEDWFGLAGVSFYAGAQVLTLAVLLYAVCRRHAGAVTSLSLSVCALFACLPSLTARPQVVSYVLIVLTCLAWARTADDGKVRWWLVPMTWAWACLHGMWPLGIVIGLTAVAGLGLDRRESRRRLGLLLLVPLLSAVAAALTPVGPGLYSEVVEVSSRAEYFEEWGPPDFTSPFMWFLGALILAVIAPLLRRGQPTTWFALSQIALAGAFSVYSARTVPVAACMLAPLAAAALASRSGRSSPLGRPDWWSASLAYAAALATMATIAPSPGSLEDRQPDWLDDTMNALPEDTVVINESRMGAYLMWRYPHLGVTAHGYGDGFTEAALRARVDAFEVEPGWDRWVESTGAEWAVLDPETPMAYGLERTLDWQVVESSDDLVLLRSPDGPSTR